MKYFILVLALFSMPAIAGVRDNPFKSQECYARMQVGVDSVINARLGLSPGYILNLDPPPVYFSIMLAAYNWRGAPIEYGLAIFNDCMGGGLDV